MAKKVEQKEAGYTKEQIVTSDKFRDSKDLLEMSLSTDEVYTLADIEKIIKDFRSRTFSDKRNGGIN